MYGAAVRGDVHLVKYLLDCRADPNQGNVKKDMPLHAASALSQGQVVECLLDAAAEVNAVNSRGFSPLNTAASLGRVEAARVLVNAGARKELPNNSGLTPLSNAAAQGNMEIICLLVEADQVLQGSTSNNGGAVRARCDEVGHEVDRKKLFDSAVVTAEEVGAGGLQ